jgi:hypothetical protein
MRYRGNVEWQFTKYCVQLQYSIIL